MSLYPPRCRRTLTVSVSRPQTLIEAVEQFRLRVQRAYTVVGEPVAQWQGNLFGDDDALVTAVVRVKEIKHVGNVS